MFRNSRVLFIVLLAMCLAAPAFSQDSRGAIAGRVVDSSNAVIVGAKVRVTNQATGVGATAATNERGSFLIPFLLPGKYRLTAEMTGFKSYTQSDLELRVADNLDLRIQLQVGAIAETIEVRGGTPLLETANSSLGQVLDEKRLEDLPQRGGNPLELERLAPGVINLTSLRVMKASSPDGTSSISANGTGNQATLYNIDGVSDTTNDKGRGYARVAFIPPSSAVSEFKLQSNPYDASVGHVYGPVINVSTKGGSNKPHGTLYYWPRNSAFDAMNFFDNKAGLRKVVYQDHRFGVSAGGPVMLPRVYDGRNKTFWFYAWEENRFGQPSTSNQTSTVPTAAERAGDFSALLALGSQYQIYNPFTTRPAGTGRYQRDPIPGNVIPKNLLSAVGLNLVNIYPLPNQPGTADGRNNYFYPDVRIQRYDSHMVRFDQAFSSNHRLFMRLNHFAYMIPKDLMGIPATKELLPQYNRGIALDDVIVLSPTWVLNLRWGVVDAEYPEKRVTQGTDLSKLGFSPALVGLVDPRRATVPRVRMGGFSTLSNWADGDGGNTAVTNNWLADLTKLKGRHTLRFGVDVRLFRTFGNRYPGSLSPDFNFANTYTRGPLDNSTAAPLGQELAAMLLGVPAGSMDVSANYAAQNRYVGLYLQDDFKLTPKLTVNLGLRYEMEWAVTERFNRLVAAFDSTVANPIEAQARINYAKSPIAELPASAFSARGGLTWVNQGGNGRGPYKGTSGEWLPRLGLAYQFTPKTVLRSGYGIYFDTLGVDRFIPIQTGFSQSTPMQASMDNGVTYVATIANPLPNGLLPAQGPKGGLATNLGQSISAFDPTLKRPYSQRWSWGVQRFLPGQFLLDVSYVGNRSTRLGVARNMNSTPAQYLSALPTRDDKTINSLTQTFPSPFYGLSSVFTSTMSRANLLKPYPEFGDINITQPIGYSWYHALQLRGEKRFSKGYTLQVGYTFSKNMQATEFLNPTDPMPYRSISNIDRPHVLAMSGVFEIPVGNGRRFMGSAPKPVNAVLGGWQLNGSVIRQAGAPLEFGNIIFTGNLHDIALSKDQRSVEHWFNTNAGFNKDSRQQLANNLRTFPLRLSGVRADGQSTWNFSLSKNFQIYERMKAQVRAEAYNVMNHPSFDVPNNSPTNSSFGVINNTVSEPRNWQFALKISF